MSAPRVLSIKRSDPSWVELRWADGSTTRFEARTLRGLCPCARCVNEMTGVRMHDPATVPIDLVQTEVKLVGNYGLALRFSDGHDTGIYPFAFLFERSDLAHGPAGSGPA